MHQITFQSTSSVWRTTTLYPDSTSYDCISIHVLRVEDDLSRPPFRWISTYFNPRPPCGGRHRVGNIKKIFVRFQSTSSVWRTTWDCLRRGGSLFHFNPRPPCGGRPQTLVPLSAADVFQSTSSVWRTTPDKYCWLWRWQISIHVLRVEDDWTLNTFVILLTDFNPRPPCGGRRHAADVVRSVGGISIHVLRVEDDLGAANI